MPLFSKIRNAKKAADEHRKSASIKESDVVSIITPYKHVPTHAGQDSLNLGASTGMGAAELRIRIKEENRRRSELIRSSSANDLYDANYGAVPMSRSRSDLSVPTHRMSLGQSPTTSRERLQVYRQSQYSYNPMRGSRSSSSNSLASLNKGKSPLSKMSSSIAELPEDDEGDDSHTDASHSSANSDSSATSAEAIEMSTSRHLRPIAGPSSSSPPKRSILSRGATASTASESDMAPPVPVRVGRAKSLRFEGGEDSPVMKSSEPMPIDSKVPSPTLGPEWNWFDNSQQLTTAVKAEQQTMTPEQVMPAVERQISNEQQKHQRIDSRMAGMVPESRAGQPALSARPPPIPYASKPTTRSSSPDGVHRLSFLEQPLGLQYTHPLSRTASQTSEQTSIYSEQHRYNSYQSTLPQQEYFDSRAVYNHDNPAFSSATPSPQLQAWQIPAEDSYSKRQTKEVVTSVVPTPMDKPKTKRGMFRMPSLMMKKSNKTAIAV